MIPPHDLQPADFASAIAAIAIQLASFVFVVVLAGIDHPGFLAHWRKGLVIGVSLALAMLPAAALDFAYFDPAAAAPPGQQDPTTLALLRGIYIASTLGGLVFLAGWTMTTYYVTRYEWGLVRDRCSSPPAVPTAPRLAVAAAIGVVIGVASTILFHLLGTGLSPFVENMLQSYPEIGSASPALLAGAGFIIASTAAVTEELQFRGAMLGFFIRVTGNRAAGFWLANVCIALAFAALHLVNVDMPLVKFGQIFVLALVFGVLARWAGVTAAIACHLAMNTAVVLGELVAPTTLLH